MRSDCLVYLSGPISPDDGYSILENAASAVKVYLECVFMGIPAVCVHLAAIFPSTNDISYNTWMDFDYAILQRCTHLVLIPRWETSAGALLEKKFAEDHHIPVLIWPELP